MLKRIIKNLSKSERGQSLVELALILPVIIVILFGILEFGLIFHSYLTITYASREGARSAIVGNPNEDILATTTKLTAHLPEPDKVVVNINPSDPLARQQGIPLTVTVNYPVELLTPVLSDILPNPVLLEASTTMRME